MFLCFLWWMNAQEMFLTFLCSWTPQTNFQTQTCFFSIYSAARSDLLWCCFLCRAGKSPVVSLAYLSWHFIFGLDWIYDHCDGLFVMLILGMPSKFPCDVDWLLKTSSSLQLPSSSGYHTSSPDTWHSDTAASFLKLQQRENKVMVVS